jgi:acyl-CoA thioesterase II
MTTTLTPAWDGGDIAELLGLDALSPRHFRSRLGELNENGRVYGGQMLGQTLAAAARTVPEGRPATAMQFVFLSGARPEMPIDYAVTSLQDGKRFSARHVRGVQAGGRIVCDANMTFATPLAAPAHRAPPPLDCGLDRDPERCARLTEIDSPGAAEIERVLAYALQAHAAIDFRAPFVEDLIGEGRAEPRMRFWIRMRRLLPDDGALHAAAFAYLSDYWINFVACIAHVAPTAASGGRLYVASLNHAIWLHRPFRADGWLLFDCVSPRGGWGRALATARVYDQSGDLVADANQECLLTPMG